MPEYLTKLRRFGNFLYENKCAMIGSALGSFASYATYDSLGLYSLWLAISGLAGGMMFDISFHTTGLDKKRGKYREIEIID